MDIHYSVTSAAPIKIMLVDDHHVVRKGIRMIIDEQPDMAVVAEADNPDQVFEILDKGIAIDIILTDLDMPRMNGIELCEIFNSRKLPLRTIVLSMLDTEQHVERAFAAGCSAYLLKSVDTAELLFALRHVHSGNQYLCSECSIRLIKRNITFASMHPSPIGELEISEREQEILELIASGLTNQEIAEKLFLSKRTIEGHRQSLLDKTGSKNTAALVRFAVLQGLLS